MWARPDLIDRHCAFHQRRPESEAALLGLVVWAAECGPSQFMEWLGTQGIQFDFAQIRDREGLPGSFFYTSNVSVKSELVRAHGGFDEAFRAAAFEDIDLGLRLKRAGMQLAFDPVAIVEHFHPTELLVTFEHVRASATGAGCSSNAIPGRFPRRPGSRHQLRAALTDSHPHPPSDGRLEIPLPRGLPRGVLGCVSRGPTAPADRGGARPPRRR